MNNPLVVACVIPGEIELYTTPPKCQEHAQKTVARPLSIETTLDEMRVGQRLRGSGITRPFVQPPSRHRNTLLKTLL